MKKLVIAIPKERRLLKKSYGYFQKTGLISTSLLVCMDRNINKKLEFETDDKKSVFLLLRSVDIPKYVNNGWVDIGISTCDYFNEYILSEKSLNSVCENMLISRDLSFFKKSRLCFAGDFKCKDYYFNRTNSYNKLIIATEYPHICKNYFSDKNVKIDVINISGSSELTPKYAHADAILDIVESGETLHNNGLVIYEELMKIEANVLINKKFIKENKEIIFSKININDYYVVK